MTSVTLFITAGCHLCDLAYAILLKANVDIQQIEIGDDDALVAQYGVRIPVVKFEDGSEINWPFELQHIETKL